MADFWLALVIGLVLGGAAGWLLRSRTPLPPAPEGSGKIAQEGAPPGEQAALNENALKALENELEVLRALIDEQETERPDDALDRLDEAVKRANGRLKLLDQSLQRIQKAEKTQEK